MSATGVVGRRAVVVHHRGLETGEGEVGFPGHRPGEAHRGRVAVLGEAVDDRAARVPEAEMARHLVERLARGVVDGLADDAVAAVGFHHHGHGVPTD